MPPNPLVRPEKIAALKERMLALNIRPEDLEESFIKGGGHGGQKVNKSNNCVYLKHLPTGVAVKCHVERSRELNRFLARRELCDALERIANGISPNKAKLIQKMRRQKNRRKRRRKSTPPPTNN
ncbi:MAG: peptide chain release factor-like protein [Akkermansia sp.]|nr:peptide chain release factor-like protein [Akkermansia sp.]